MKESNHSAPLNDGAKASEPLVATAPKSILKKTTSVASADNKMKVNYQRTISWHEEVDSKEEERAVAEAQRQEAGCEARQQKTYSIGNNHSSIWHAAVLLSGVAAATSIAYDIYTRKI